MNGMSATDMTYISRYMMSLMADGKNLATNIKVEHKSIVYVGGKPVGEICGVNDSIKFYAKSEFEQYAPPSKIKGE